ADAVLTAGAPPSTATLFDVAWCCIRDDRLGLAHHLASHANAVDPDHEPRLPAWLVRATAVARHVTYPGSEVAAPLGVALAAYDSEIFLVEAEDWQMALRLLLVAAILRPALLAPESHAHTLLTESHHHGLRQLFDYCEAISTFAHHQRPLDPN